MNGSVTSSHTKPSAAAVAMRSDRRSRGNASSSSANSDARACGSSVDAVRSLGALSLHKLERRAPLGPRRGLLERRGGLQYQRVGVPQPPDDLERPRAVHRR